MPTLHTSKPCTTCVTPRFVAPISAQISEFAVANHTSLQEPKLWYGIGILYDRYGSLDHAEEAFSQVMRMAPDFEKANEIYFRLGIIYKQQQKFNQSLECFRYIVNDPPRPLTEEDIYFQIGHVHEQQKDVSDAPFPPFSCSVLTVAQSLTLPKTPIAECLTRTRTMPRSCNSSDGCTTSRATVTQAKKRLSNTWRNPSAQVSLHNKIRTMSNK